MATSRAEATPAGRNFGGGGNFGGGPGGQAGPGGTARGAIEQELLTCLRQQGFTGSANQLRQQASDPQLRQAFETCLQQLRNSSSQLPGRP